MKFSIEKKRLDTLKILRSDREFHDRAIDRIKVDWEVVLMVEKQRTGMAKREIKEINLIKGEIEYGNIIIAKDVPKENGNSQPE